MAINRSSIAKELLPGLNAVFGTEYGEVNDEHKPLYETGNLYRSIKANDGKLNSLELVKYLDKYAETGVEYTKILKN